MCATVPCVASRNVRHSAASTLAWLAADVRPEAVSSAVFVGGFPAGDGETYANFFEPVQGVAKFPGWGAFEGPDSADIDEGVRRRMELKMVSVAEGAPREPCASLTFVGTSFP